METHAHEPSRTFPAIFLLLSLAGIVVVFAVPWMGVGSAILPTEWSWAHDIFPLFGGSAAQAHLVAVAGFLLGALGSLAWLAMISFLPESQWTARREAALATLQAPSLMLVAAAGGMGIGYSFLAGDGNNWAVSPAGITLLSMAGIGAVALTVALLPRIPTRRAPLALVVGIIVASALFHALPWLTHTRTAGFGAGETTNYVRPMFQLFGFDPLAPLGRALGLLGAIATLWTLAVALLPSDVRRDAQVDAGFAFAALVPLTFAAVGIGRMVGASLGGFDAAFGGGIPGALEGDVDGSVYAVNAYVFSGLLVAATALVAATLARRARDLDAGWSA